MGVRVQDLLLGPPLAFTADLLSVTCSLARVLVSKCFINGAIKDATANPGKQTGEGKNLLR